MSEASITEGKTLATAQVGILGLGLMGGSLALALRGHCAAILGSDPAPDTLRLALERGIVDQASADPGQILPLADLVVLAAPVLEILKLLGNLDCLHPGSAVVLDLGSTKRHIVEAMEVLPKRFNPIGGHPICGKEKPSLDNADPLIFREAVFVLTPLARTSELAKMLAQELVLALGAHPLWLEAEEHDRLVAVTSHLPYLLANALALSSPLECSALIGPGFRSTSRLAASFSPMMLDVLQTNRQNVLEALDDFRLRLDQLEDLLAQGKFNELSDLLASTARHWQSLTS